MAVQAQFGGLVLPPYAYAAAEAQQPMRAALKKDYGALLSTAAVAAPEAADHGYACGGGGQYDYYCATQSELTCNRGSEAPVDVPVRTRKRGREEDQDDLWHCYAPLLPPPLPVTRPHYSATPAAASTSGRAGEAARPLAAAADQVWRYGAAEAEVDALVRAECDRLRAGLPEVARERQRRALVRAAAAAATVTSSGMLARRAREAEAQLEAARRRAAELEERVRLAAAEAQAWCGVARGNEAVAMGLQATLDALLLRSSSLPGDGEGFGESASAEPDDAQSCCCVVGGGRVAGDHDDRALAASPAKAATWACRACGDGEASVLVLPCRHLCLCKACEPRADACPVCSGDKNAALHIATS